MVNTGILGYARSNVKIIDNYDNSVLFDGHNLFTVIGKRFIRDLVGYQSSVLQGAKPFNPSYYTVEFGTGSSTSTTDDQDLEVPLSPVAYQGVSTVTIPSPTTPQLDMLFHYTNATGGSVIVRELGLFYRPNSIVRPATIQDASALLNTVGYMVARLRTTYTTVSIGSGRSITLTWSIIF